MKIFTNEFNVGYLRRISSFTSGLEKFFLLSYTVYNVRKFQLNCIKRVLISQKLH